MGHHKEAGWGLEGRLGPSQSHDGREEGHATEGQWEEGPQAGYSDDRMRQKLPQLILVEVHYRRPTEPVGVLMEGVTAMGGGPQRTDHKGKWKGP